MAVTPTELAAAIQDLALRLHQINLAIPANVTNRPVMAGAKSLINQAGAAFREIDATARAGQAPTDEQLGNLRKVASRLQSAAVVASAAKQMRVFRVLQKTARAVTQAHLEASRSRRYLDDKSKAAANRIIREAAKKAREAKTTAKQTLAKRAKLAKAVATEIKADATEIKRVQTAKAKKKRAAEQAYGKTFSGRIASIPKRLAAMGPIGALGSLATAAYVAYKAIDSFAKAAVGSECQNRPGFRSYAARHESGQNSRHVPEYAPRQQTSRISASLDERGTETQNRNRGVEQVLARNQERAGNRMA